MFQIRNEFKLHTSLRWFNCFGDCISVTRGCVFYFFLHSFFLFGLEFGVVLYFCVCSIWFVFGCMDSNPTCLHTNVVSLGKDVLANVSKLVGVIAAFP